jgi:hypothetical protein
MPGLHVPRGTGSADGPLLAVPVHSCACPDPATTTLTSRSDPVDHTTHTDLSRRESLLGHRQRAPRTLGCGRFCRSIRGQVTRRSVGLDVSALPAPAARISPVVQTLCTYDFLHCGDIYAYSTVRLFIRFLLIVSVAPYRCRSYSIEGYLYIRLRVLAAGT